MNKTIVIVLVVLGIGAFALVVCGGIGAAIFLPALARAREAARRASCQNNLKQMGIVFQMWASEHEGKLPDSLPQIYPQYLTDLQVLDCPSSGLVTVTQTDLATGGDYEYLGAGLDLDDIPSDTVIMRGKFADAHVPAGRNVLYADGTVVFQRAGAGP